MSCNQINRKMDTSNKLNYTCKNCRATAFCSYHYLIEHSLNCANKKRKISIMKSIVVAIKETISL